MADFFGSLARVLTSEPFPDADAGTPLIPDVSPEAYPTGAFDPIGAVPGVSPNERVGGLGVGAFGVDRNDPDVKNDAQQSNALSGPATLEAIRKPGIVPRTFGGVIGRHFSVDWFEKWHVFPGSLALGNVLTTQIRNLEVFNAFRRENRTWTSFTNNAGAGITATNLPVLPLLIGALDSFILDIQVSTDGPPSINGTLDFGVDLNPPGTIEITITGNRITIFAYRPQTPIRESLEFLTDILPHDDSSEQRISQREAPRQQFGFTIRTPDDRTRDALYALITDWQARVFGVPVWHEQRPLQTSLALLDTTVVVDTTLADYRVGGLVMLYRDNFYSETLEITAVNAGDIELQVGVSRTFDAADTIVMPVRTAYTSPQLNQARYPIGPADFPINFEVLDNVPLPDASAFDTYMGVGQTVAKPVINRLNIMRGRTIADGHRRDVAVIDHKVGPKLQFSPWTKSRPVYSFGFDAQTRQELWDIRGLMHFIRGSQLSFYVATGRKDIKPLGDIGDLAASITIANIGFARFYQQVTPRSDMQIERVDGTVSRHTIDSSSEIDENTETISFTPVISPALPLAELIKIEFLTLSRITDDKVDFVHDRMDQSTADMKLTGVVA